MESTPIIPSRTETLRSWREHGGGVAAVLPIHYPRALLRAFGLLPMEVWGPPRVDPALGAAHLQPYVCSVVGNALSFLLRGGLEVADVIIVPHACDSLQGLGSLLLDFVRPRQPVFPLYLPRGRRDSDLRFLADECRALYGELAAVTGHAPSEAELMESIRREEEADGLLTELHRRRRVLPLTDLAFYRLVRAREYLPAEEFATLARSVLSAPPADPRTGIPILLSGILPEPMALLDAVNKMGGTVVADDLACCGRRLYPPGVSGEPFLRMAERILNGPPDPTRGSPIAERLRHLVGMAQETGARGVIFYGVKFCEPELFDLPLLRRGLQEAGLPSVPIEVDLNDPLSHQVLTRIEAFLEMVAGQTPKEGRR
ncbi:MAG: 2-hydroxyacyl-CoA dehydratase subunit D [Anaerolineae bacterium]